VVNSPRPVTVGCFLDEDHNQDAVEFYFHLVLIAPAMVMIRFQCSQLVVERLDPLVHPRVFTLTAALPDYWWGLSYPYPTAIPSANSHRTPSMHSWIPR
jgi:hypothetical protein